MCRTRQHSPQNLKALFDKPTCIPVIRFPFSFLYRKQDRNTLGVLTPKHRNLNWPIGSYSQQLTLGHGDTLLALVITVTPLLAKVTQKKSLWDPFDYFYTSCCRAFPEFPLNSALLRQLPHLPWGLFVSCLHRTLSQGNNLNSAALPSIISEVPDDCLMLTDHLLTPCEIYRKFHQVSLTIHGSLMVLILKVTMANTVLLQLLLMLLR